MLAFRSAVVTVELKPKTFLFTTPVSELIKSGSDASIDFRAALAAADTPDAVLPKAQIRLLTAVFIADTKVETVEATSVPNVLEILLTAFERAVST